MRPAPLIAFLAGLLAECDPPPPLPPPPIAVAQAPSSVSDSQSQSPLASARASQFADSVLKLMTLEEKLGQLNQAAGIGTRNGPRVPEGGEKLIRSGRVGSFLGIFGAEYTR